MHYNRERSARAMHRVRTVRCAVVPIALAEAAARRTATSPAALIGETSVEFFGGSLPDELRRAMPAYRAPFVIPAAVLVARRPRATSVKRSSARRLGYR